MKKEFKAEPITYKVKHELGIAGRCRPGTKVVEFWCAKGGRYFGALGYENASRLRMLCSCTGCEYANPWTPPVVRKPNIFKRVFRWFTRRLT